MGHSVVRTESGQNHFHSSEISPKRGTTFSRQRQFTSNKINELIHVRQRIVLKMGLTSLSWAMHRRPQFSTPASRMRLEPRERRGLLPTALLKAFRTMTWEKSRLPQTN